MATKNPERPKRRTSRIAGVVANAFNRRLASIHSWTPELRKTLYLWNDRLSKGTGKRWSDMNDVEQEMTVDALNLHWWMNEDDIGADELAWPDNDSFDLVEPIFFAVTAFGRTWLAAITGQSGMAPQTRQQVEAMDHLRETMPPVVYPYDVLICNGNGGGNVSPVRKHR